MKLLYLERTLAIHGGVERVVTDKLNWLVEYGNCEVCLLTVYQANHPKVFPLNTKVKFRDLGIGFHKIYNYPWYRRFFANSSLHKLLRNRLSDEIHIFNPDVIICTRLDYIRDLSSVSGSVPLVYESHSLFLASKFEKLNWKQRLQIKLCHRALRNVKMIVSLTNGDAKEWKKLNQNVTVIPNAVHLNATSRYSDCSNKSAIFVGRFSMQKDIDLLLRIWSIVHLHCPDWALHIYGGYGEEKESIAFECKRMNANIYIHEPTYDIIEKYKENSMLLLTSRYEPFGLVLPEAMSCGLPVVAFDCPYGPADIITDGVDGFLIKNRSIEEYVDKVCLLIDNEELRLKMGREGILSSQRYLASRIMPEWICLFKKLSSN